MKALTILTRIALTTFYLLALCFALICCLPFILCVFEE